MSERVALVPGGGILSEFAHACGQVTLDHVGQAHGLQDLPLRGPQRDEDLGQPSRGTGVMQVLRAGAGNVGERAVDGPDDIGEGDVGGRTCEGPATLDAATRMDDVGLAELGEDGAEVGRRDVLTILEFVRGHRSIRCGREFEDGAQGIVRPPRKSHGPSIGRAPSPPLIDAAGALNVDNGGDRAVDRHERRRRRPLGVRAKPALVSAVIRWSSDGSVPISWPSIRVMVVGCPARPDASDSAALA